MLNKNNFINNNNEECAGYNDLAKINFIDYLINNDLNHFSNIEIHNNCSGGIVLEYIYNTIEYGVYFNNDGKVILYDYSNF